MSHAAQLMGCHARRGAAQMLGESRVCSWLCLLHMLAANQRFMVLHRQNRTYAGREWALRLPPHRRHCCTAPKPPRIFSK